MLKLEQLQTIYRNAVQQYAIENCKLMNTQLTLLQLREYSMRNVSHLYWVCNNCADFVSLPTNTTPISLPCSCGGTYQVEREPLTDEEIEEGTDELAYYDMLEQFMS